MAKLFGTNGIRGVFGEDFNLEFIHDIVISIAKYFKNGPILVGFDGRHSSIIVSKVVAAALNHSGLDCKIVGLVPTPCLEFAVKKLGCQGGIMITASHNPSQYNGIKPAASDGVEISREDELVIEDIYFNQKWQKSNLDYGTTSNEEGAVRIYLDGIKSHVDISSIQERKLKVVLDLGNGAQAITAPLLCQELGCDVITLNEKIDGNFPGRGSEPTPQNLSELSNKVIEHNADVGVAFDGDGDRSLFCDNLGTILTGDKSALLLTKYLLAKQPGSIVVTCLNSGSSIEEITSQHNSKVIRTKVGSVEVSRMMVPKKALIGFEENGGFMFGQHNEVRDGAMTLALVLELLATSNFDLSKHIQNLPTSFTTKDKLPCSPKDVDKIIKTLKEENPSATTIDGLKIEFDSKNWVMIRPSGTEPILRIYAEASSQEKLDSLMTKYTQKIKSILSG